MKATTATIVKTPGTGLRARCGVLLLAALLVTIAPRLSVATDQVPFTGSAVGAIVSAVPGDEGVELTVAATGKATHLGKFTREEEVLLNPDTGAISGTIIFTAANGDQLICEAEGGFTSPTTATGTYTFTGGTGRFKNATGEAEFFVTTPDGVHFTVEFSGTISSVGANKK